MRCWRNKSHINVGWNIKIWITLMIIILEKILNYANKQLYINSYYIILDCLGSSCRFLVSQVWIYQNDWKQITCIYIVKDGTWKKTWLRYVNFCQFYMPLNMEENKVHFRHLMLFLCAKMSHKRQTKYALFMAKML